MLDKSIFQLCNSIKIEDLDRLQQTDNYIAQIKKDGERVLAISINNRIILFNRRGNIINKNFSEIVKELTLLSVYLKGFNNGTGDFIIDTELTTADDNFNLLQKRALTQNKQKIITLQNQIKVKLFIFDILKLSGEDLRDKPLCERNTILNNIFDYLKEKKAEFEFIELLESTKNLKDLLYKAQQTGKEGIVVKDLRAKYESKRTDNWLKLKLFKEKDIIFNKYEVNNAGITLENDEGIRVLVAGTQAEEVKKLIDLNKNVSVSIQYLEEKQNNKLRFPSFKKLSESNFNDDKFNITNIETKHL
jgi:ATP-dependent DNA ligase